MNMNYDGSLPGRINTVFDFGFRPDVQTSFVPAPLEYCTVQYCRVHTYFVQDLYTSPTTFTRF